MFSTSDSEVGPSPTKKAKCVAGSDSELSNQEGAAAFNIVLFS